MSAEITVYNKEGVKTTTFKDNYNDQCLLWLAGKQWWLDIAPLRTDQQRIKELDLILERLYNRREWIAEAFTAEWSNHYLTKMRELEVLLEQASKALREGGVVEWSL